MLRVKGPPCSARKFELKYRPEARRCEAKAVQCLLICIPKLTLLPYCKLAGIILA